MTLEDQIALDVLEDDAAVEAALSLAEMEADAGFRSGLGHGGHQTATQLAADARLRFRAAQEARRAGDHSEAIAEAGEARRLIARAMSAMDGPGSAWSLVERVEALMASVSEDPTSYADPDGLLKELAAMLGRARARLQNGDGIGAGALAVLAQQRHQHRVAPDPEARRHRADLAVALAGTGVSLAARILDEQGADEEQLRYLHAAREYLSAARKALEAGNDRRAIYLASHAMWSALKALVLPGGVSMEEARAMAELAEGLYLEAVATVGDDPTDLQAALLRRSRHLIDVGLEKLAEGFPRGIGALWRAAVICAWLVG
jgi:hypothetical protein